MGHGEIPYQAESEEYRWYHQQTGETTLDIILYVKLYIY